MKKEVDMVNYLISIGEPLIKCGHHYYMHQKHDSLKINTVKNAFFWNSRNVGGGILQYLMAVYGLTREEAFQKYRNDTRQKAFSSSTNKEVYLQKFVYSLEEVLPYEAKKYLVIERKISNDIVQKLINEGYISQEKQHNNVIFKWYDQQKLVGYSLQGTVKLTMEFKKRFNWKRNYFKSVAKTTEKYTKWGFNYCIGKPANLFLFESPIDLLSYWTLYEKRLKDIWLISLEGGDISRITNFLKAVGKNYKSLEIASIKLGFDRDKSGDTFIKRFNELNLENIAGKTIQIEECRPPKLNNEKTDWNDYLKYKKNNWKI